MFVFLDGFHMVIFQLYFEALIYIYSNTYMCILYIYIYNSQIYIYIHYIYYI